MNYNFCCMYRESFVLILIKKINLKLDCILLLSFFIFIALSFANIYIYICINV